jgi:hypothetical protein
MATAKIPKVCDVFPVASCDTLRANIEALNGAPFQLKTWRTRTGAFVQVCKVRPAGAAATTDDPDPAPIDESYTCPGNPRCP